MKDKGKKKSHKLSERAQAMAEQIAFQNVVSNTFVFCMERGLLCTVLLKGERWTQRHVWRVLGVGRDFVYCMHADQFRYAGYEVHRLDDVAAISPAPELTEQYHLMQVTLPESVPELDLASIETALEGLFLQDCLIQVGHVGEQEDDSILYTGHLTKLGKKKVALRELDLHDLAWSTQSVKMAYEDVDCLTFGTPALQAFEQLAMPYEAFIRSLNEAVSLPPDTEDFEMGTDLMEGANEDTIDLDDFTDFMNVGDESGVGGIDE